MGWDAWLAMQCAPPEDPVRRFVRLDSAMRARGVAGELIRLVVRRERHLELHDGMDAKRYQPEEHRRPMDPAIVAGLPDRYRGEDLAVEGWWEVERYAWNAVQGVAERDDYRVILTTVGQRFTWPGLKVPADVVYNVGDSRWFSPEVRHDAAAKNLQVLLREVATMSGLGVTSIVALDAEHSDDPGAGWLCYHHDAQGFRDDLARITGRAPVRPLNGDLLLEAGCRSPGIGLLEAESLPIVYHERAVDGDLRSFYRDLAGVAG